MEAPLKEPEILPKASTDTIRVGLVGYGYWGPNLARNFEECEGTRLASVCDRRPERLRAAARRYPGAKLTSNPEALLRASEVDAVAIATPVSTHYELALRALRAGKHVLLEKPLALSSEQGERLVEEAERQKRVLMVDHTFVYSGAVRRIRDLVASGVFGRIYYYDSVRINLGLFQSDVNVLWDLAVHDLAIMDYVLGKEARRLSALAVSHFEDRPENTAYLTLAFDDNLIAHIHANWLAPVKLRRTVIGGSQKMAVYDDLEPSDKVKLYDRGVEMTAGDADLHQRLVSYRTGDMYSPKLDTTEALQVEVAHFAHCIRTGSPPLTDGRAGLRVVRLLEAAGRSIREGGRLVELSA